MKLITLLIVLFLFNSCGNNKKVVLTNNKEVIILSDGVEEKDGDVSVVISNHSNLNLKDDTIGAIYPVIASGNAIVINFKYEEKKSNLSMEHPAELGPDQIGSRSGGP